MAINFAVENQPRAFVAARHWLMTWRAERSMIESRRRNPNPPRRSIEDQLTCVVRSTM